MSTGPNQQDIANREFERITPGLSDGITGMRMKGFQQVTLVPGQEFPLMSGYVATGPSVFNNYASNDMGPGVTPIVTPITPGGPGGGTTGPGEGGEGGGCCGGAGPGEETRYSCVDNQCVPDPDGAFFELGECQESGCDSDQNEDDVDGNNGQGGGNSPTVLNPFMAQLTSASGPTVASGRSQWTYGWVEVERLSSGFGWTNVVNGRTSTVLGVAHNQYEVSVNDNGSNVAPTGVTVNRRQYPLSVVAMHLDKNNRPWFCMPNPLETICPP